MRFKTHSHPATWLLAAILLASPGFTNQALSQSRGAPVGPARRPLETVAPRITRAWPSAGENVEGWRPLTRRYLANWVGRTLQRYQRDSEYPSQEVPQDVSPQDLVHVVRALSAEVMSARTGKFQPKRTVTRMEFALVLDRLGRACRGWPQKIAPRRFRFPTDVRRPRDQLAALNRLFRLRVVRAEDGTFRPRAQISRYEGAIGLDRLLTVLGTRSARRPLEYPDVPASHFARRALRDLYTRGIMGPPILEKGVTHLDPGAHRLLGGNRPVLPLAARPFKPRTTTDLITSELPTARDLDSLNATVQNLETTRVALHNAWDRLRVQGASGGEPRRKLLEGIQKKRREVGRAHLAMGRLWEDLPRGGKGSAESRQRETLLPAVKTARAEAKRVYKLYTRLFDQVRGTASTPLPKEVPAGLPLAARGTSLAGILPGGLITSVALSAVENQLAVAPREVPRFGSRTESSNPSNSSPKSSLAPPPPSAVPPAEPPSPGGSMESELDGFGEDDGFGDLEENPGLGGGEELDDLGLDDLDF